jgi:Uma2 family endonuclease
MMTQTQSSAALAVNIPLTLTLTVTHEQFVELAIANRELQLERTATGELIVNPPTGGETGYQEIWSIEGQLWLWNRQTKLGKHLTLLLVFTCPMEPIALLMRLGCVKKGGTHSLLNKKKAFFP